MNGADNPIVLSVMFIWFIMILLVICMLPFVKTIIILEGLPILDAIKKSFYLAFENLGLTLKMSAISLLFNIRLIINILFIIWIPLAGIILFQFIWLGKSGFADATIYILFFAVLLFLAYIDSLVEWYFRIYRYLWYLKVTWDTEKLTQLWVTKWSHDWLFEAKHVDDMELLEMVG